MLYKSIPQFRSALLDIDRTWDLNKIINFTKEAKEWIEQNYSITTKITLFSNLRKQIEKVFSKDSDEYRHMRILAMTMDERKTRDRITAERISEKNSNLTHISVNDYNNLIDKINTLPSLPRDILYCAIFSGARTVEILSNKFSFKKSDKKNHIIQIGASKTKNEIEIVKPLFTKFKTFKSMLERVRSNVDQTLSNIELNQKYGKMLANAVDKLDMKIIKKPHDLRRIYAAVAFYKYAKYTKTQQQYYSEILGHDSTNSAQHYTQYIFRG